MERIALSFLAGAATVTFFVVITGGHSAALFTLGFLAALAFVSLVTWAIGARRIARLFARIAEPAEVRIQRPAVRQAAPVAGRRTRQPRPVTDETLYARYQRMPKREKMRVELDAWNEAFEQDLDAPEPAEEAVEMFSAPVTPINSAADVEAEVASALVNLGIRKQAAAAAVAEARKNSPASFEPLFKAALAVARKAA